MAGVDLKDYDLHTVTIMYFIIRGTFVSISIFFHLKHLPRVRDISFKINSRHKTKDTLEGLEPALEKKMANDIASWPPEKVIGQI